MNNYSEKYNEIINKITNIKKLNTDKSKEYLDELNTVLDVFIEQIDNYIGTNINKIDSTTGFIDTNNKNYKNYNKKLLDYYPVLKFLWGATGLDTLQDEYVTNIAGLPSTYYDYLAIDLINKNIHMYIKKDDYFNCKNKEDCIPVSFVVREPINKLWGIEYNFMFHKQFITNIIKTLNLYKDNGVKIFE